MKMLVQGENCRLTETAVPDKDDLAVCLGDFLEIDQRGIHIAVVCGVSSPWTTEVMVRYMGKDADQSIIRISENFNQAIYATSKCVAAKDQHNENQDAVFLAFFSTIADLLSKIAQKLTPANNNNNKIEKAKSGLDTSCGMIRAIAVLPVCLTNATLAVNISELLSYGPDGEDQCADGFPAVRILVFLPDSAFDEFEKEDRFFFRQIGKVLLFKDPKIAELEEQLAELRKQLEIANAELAKNRTVNASLRSQVAALRKQVEELQKRLEELQKKQQEDAVDQMEALLDTSLEDDTDLFPLTTKEKMLQYLSKKYNIENIQSTKEETMKENPNLGEFAAKSLDNRKHSGEDHSRACVNLEQQVGSKNEDMSQKDADVSDVHTEVKRYIEKSDDENVPIDPNRGEIEYDR